MPKGLMVYFSQSGTTSKVAESIARGARARGLDVEVASIRDKGPGETVGYDFFGIGSPVYACRIPFNVSDYVGSLPDLEAVPTFSFNLYGTYPFDAGRQLRNLLARKGVRDVGYFSCRGAEYNLGYLQKGYLFSPDNPTSEDMAQAEAFGCEVADRVLGKEYSPVEAFNPPSLIYRLERMLCDRFFIEQLMTRTFRVNAKSCNACGMCMKLCPNLNIKKDENGRPKWGRHCLGCATCQMKCPKEAITSMLSMLGPMFDYNVRHMAADPTLQFARVRHHNGRTERLQ